VTDVRDRTQPPAVEVAPEPSLAPRPGRPRSSSAHTTAGPAGAKHETLFDLEEMELNFGPQHPSTHGVLRLKLRIDGERIVDCYPIIGYLHRGTEKLFELHPFFQNVPHTDRMDYVAAATNNLAYVGTVEKLLGLVVPPRARYIRVLLCELQRISSHLLWLATHAIDIGAMTPFFYCFRERELLLYLFEEYCGARLTLNCMRPGGQPYDLPVDQYDLYLTSGHGRKLREGDPRVAVCSDCHGPHEILAGSDPASRVYVTNIPRTCGGCHGDSALVRARGLDNTYHEYLSSVHAKQLLDGGNLRAPTCVSCHGVHGAVPPEVGDVNKVCGRCHTA